MIALYYLFFGLFLLVASPTLFFAAKTRAGIWQKLGIVPPEFVEKLPANGKRVWFHAVSVGEFNAIYPLIRQLKADYGDLCICVSTTTATGQRLAKEKVGDWAHIFYFPFDLPFAVGNWLNAIKPELLVIAETEIWPGLSVECARRGIALCSVNGRISPKSFRSYETLRPLFAPVLKRYRAIITQSEQEKRRYLQLGANESSLYCSGNLKFDGITSISPAEKRDLLVRLNVSDKDFVIVGGSTHEGEEAALLTALNTLRKDTPSIRLILAPRHPERFARVFKIVESHGYRVRKFSQDEGFERESDVFVLDTIGKLSAYYSVASVAFVGGTLVPIGGHSLVEPFTYSIPVICGPHIYKTRDVASALLERQALVLVQDEKQLIHDLATLIPNPDRRKQLGERGNRYVQESQGAVKRTAAILSSILFPEEPTQQDEVQMYSYHVEPAIKDKEERPQEIHNQRERHQLDGAAFVALRSKST
jgi:3-deoxy-D-manno-octulosonic-acid transferase